MPNLDWPSTPECQVVFEMFSSPRGRVSLGRLNGGREVGRLVVLREVSESALVRTRQAAAEFSAMSQPKLLKVVGLVSDESHYYLASEYIPGVSLYELIDAVRSRQRPLATAAAVRIVIDALALVGAGRALLRDHGRPLVRLLHADCIWIAEFGETLLAGAGVAGYVAANADSASELEDQDTLPAALELFQLATGRLPVGDLCASARAHLPRPLAEVMEEVFSGEYGSGLDAAANFSAALSHLPPGLVGTEALVAEELRSLVAELLDDRKRRVAALKDGSNSPNVEDPTRVYAAILANSGVEEATIALLRQRIEPKHMRPMEVESPAPRQQSQFEALVPRRTSPPRAAAAAERSAPAPAAAPQGPAPGAPVRRPWLRQALFLLLILVSGSALGLGLARPTWCRHAIADVQALLTKLRTNLP